MNHLAYTIAVVLYLSILGFLGYLGYRGTRNAADYLIGGRKIHPFVMALSYGATFISTSAIVGFGGAASVFGMGILWLTFLNIFAGIFIAFIFFGKRTRKMGHNLDAHTFPEFLGRRFQSPFIQKFAGLLIFITMPLYAGVVLIGAVRFIEANLNIQYDAALLFFTAIIAVYVMMGGLKGVMYTDALQGSVMLLGMLMLLIFAYSGLGGVTEAHRKLTEYAPRAVEAFGARGHNGWTAMPSAGQPMWWTLVSTIIMGVGIGVLAQPQLVIRFMTVKSNRELNRAVLIGGVFILLMTGVAFVVGALSNVYFLEDPAFGQISVQAAAGTDRVIPLFISRYLPGWFGVIFMLTLLSAAMSTLSSQFHTMGTALSRDFYERIKECNGEKSLFISRVGVVVTILISTTLAYVLPQIGTEAVIAKGTALFFGLCAASFLPAYIGALYFPKMPRKAAITGMLAGCAAAMFWLLFIFSDVSNAFGITSLAAGTVWEWVDPIFIGLPVSMAATLAGSLLFSIDVPAEHQQACFQGVVSRNIVNIYVQRR